MRPAINAMVRNTRWLWLMASSDAVFQNIRCFRSQDNAKHLLGEASHGVVVTDQCASYNWLDQRVTSFAWLMFNAICKRWRNTLAVDKRPTLVVGSCCYSRACSAPSMVTRLNSSLSHCGSGRCSDYDEVSSALDQGCEVPARRYAGRCQHILKYEAGLWVFYGTGNAADQ